MATFLKIFGKFSLVLIAVAVILFTFDFLSEPEYEVWVSYPSGQCHEVRRQGNVVPNGCKKVISGEIKHYESFFGR